VVSSGEVVSSDSVSKQTIASPVRYLAEVEEAAALAASLFSAASFLQPTRSWSPLFEIARVLVRFAHVASGIVNANRDIMRAAAVHCVADCNIQRVIPQPPERQHIRDQIDAAFIFARADFVSRPCLTQPRKWLPI